MIKKYGSKVLSYIGRSKNFTNAGMHRNSFKDLARPSFTREIQKIIPFVVAEYEEKEMEMRKSYGWIKESTTIKSYENKTVLYSNKNRGTISFNTFNVARYNTKTSVWSWSWVNHENEAEHDDDSNFFRGYGSSKKIELMIKANWNATEEEVTEVLALCVRLRSALGVDVEEKDGFQYFRLILAD